MILSVATISIMSFIGPSPDFYCYKYVGPRPATDADIINSANYTKGAINTMFSWPKPLQIWCGFCIETSSRYFDGTTVDVKWSDLDFIALLQDGSPTEIYDDTSLDDTELIDAFGRTHIYVYFRRNID